jgi:hypothetical protein
MCGFIESISTAKPAGVFGLAFFPKKQAANSVFGDCMNCGKLVLKD